MNFDSDLEFICETAKSDSADAKICRQVLISLWDDGEPDGCELLGLLSLEKRCFDAVYAVLQHLHSKQLQLDMYMSTKQITSIVSVDAMTMDNSPVSENNDPYSHRL